LQEQLVLLGEALLALIAGDHVASEADVEGEE